MAELEGRHTAMMQDIDRDERPGRAPGLYKGSPNERARRQAEKIHELSVANAKNRAEEARATETLDDEYRKMAIELMCTLPTAAINRRRSQCLQQSVPTRNRRNARVEDNSTAPPEVTDRGITVEPLSSSSRLDQHFARSAGVNFAVRIVLGLAAFRQK